MFNLVLLTLALIVVTGFLFLLMQIGFIRGIAWFDEHNKERERNYAEARARYIKARQAQTRRHAARPASVEDQEEWAEYIDV